MKTKDLISQLQEADPSGELEVVVGKCDIHFVEKLPMFYDGFPIVLLRDKSEHNYYNVLGFKATGSGDKVQIHLLDASDVISNDPDCIVELDAYAHAHMGAWVDLYRSFSKENLEKIPDEENEET